MPLQMLLSYLNVFFRTFRREVRYSVINVIGLSIGIACSLLVALWLQNELTWDGFHKKRDRLYQVYLNNITSTGVNTSPAVSLPLVEALKSHSEIEFAVPTDWGGSHLISFKDKRIEKRALHVGRDFLQMFDFPLLKGSDRILHDPQSVVITTSTAKALFGEDDPINKIIRMDNAVELSVGGVVADTPQNSTFQFDLLIPFENLIISQPLVKEAESNWEYQAFQIYILLESKAEVEGLKGRIEDLIKIHQEGHKKEVILHPLSKWRLYSEFENGVGTSGLIVYVRIFAVIGVFIFLIACINFINLTTARSQQRSVEIGIRKSLGSGKNQLILQFLCETTFLAVLAFCIGLLLVHLALPLFNYLVNKKLAIDYGDYKAWGVSLVLIMATGVIAGLYPALYLSSFNPAKVLKGESSNTTRLLPRKIMVAFQFVITTSLIILTLVVYLQINHLKLRPLGYNPDRLISINATPEILLRFDVIKNKLLSDGNIVSVSKSDVPITTLWSYAYTENGNVEWPGKVNDSRDIAIVSVEYDYAKTMGIDMIEGRDFTQGFNDSSSVIINKTAADYMGLKHPIGERIRWFGRELSIVGVTEDVVMKSPYAPIDPMVMLFEPSSIHTITMRLAPNKDLSTLIAEIQKVFETYNPNYPFTYSFIDTLFLQKFEEFNRIGNIASAFSVLAILISCLGLLGLISFVITQRTRELAIRKTLGATVSNVLVLLSQDFLKLCVFAFIVAIPSSYWAAHLWLQQYYYRTSLPMWIFVMAGAIVFFLVLLTISLQSIKAAVSNSASALRRE